MICPNCKTELSQNATKCPNCNYIVDLDAPFLTPLIKKQIVIAIVVFILAFLGTRYAIAEYKKSNMEKEVELIKQ